jgi:hypothetical protein
MTARRTSTTAMAKVLAETVVELSDVIVCRKVLGFAGFNDEQISEHLSNAQWLARQIRGEEIERLAHKELKI